MTKEYKMTNILLGVNIDHIATIRNTRGQNYPDPVHAAFIAEQSGANSITLHLREDRRHIKDRDVYILRDTIQTKMNLEMAITDEMIKIACDIKPDVCCLVPENRQELTTEGGLNILLNKKKVNNAVKKLQEEGILVSLFIDADYNQIDASIASGATCVEIHTGKYAEAKDDIVQDNEFLRIRQAVNYAAKLGLKVNAGHGLNYHNVTQIASVKQINELNIGHSIISCATIEGLSEAVKKMKYLLKRARD